MPKDHREKSESYFEGRNTRVVAFGNREQKEMNTFQFIERNTNGRNHLDDRGSNKNTYK